MKNKAIASPLFIAALVGFDIRLTLFLAEIIILLEKKI